MRLIEMSNKEFLAFDKMTRREKGKYIALKKAQLLEREQFNV